MTSSVSNNQANVPLDGMKILSVDRLIDNSVTDFDVFLKIQNHLILYGGSGYLWLRREISDLLRNGVHSFYVKGEDHDKVRMYLIMNRMPEIQKSQAPSDRIASLDQIGAQFTKYLYEGHLTESCILTGKKIGAEIVNCVREDVGCVKWLNKLVEYDAYTYHHSIRVAAYAVAIGIGLGLGDEAALKEIALGGVFHDIGKRDVALALLHKRGALTEEEWVFVRAHPLNGWECLKESILSHVPREIVLHHHEKRNGAGYPDALTDKSLLPEVKIATLADIFDALTSTRSYQNSRSHFDALDFIKSKLISDEICPESFRALVRVLAS